MGRLPMELQILLRYLLYNFLCHRYFRLLNKRLSEWIQTDTMNHFGLLSHRIFSATTGQSTNVQKKILDKMTPQAK